MQGALASHYADALADAVFAPNSGLKPEDAVQQLRAVDELISGSQQLQLAFADKVGRRNMAGDRIPVNLPDYDLLVCRGHSFLKHSDNNSAIKRCHLGKIRVTQARAPAPHMQLDSRTFPTKSGS